MSKKKGYAFSGTKGDIVHLIQNLPPKPSKEFLEDWNVFVSPKALGRTNSAEFWHKETKLRVRFDVGQEGKPGFRSKDHWHVYNPNRTSKLDAYLDENANPTYDGSNPSHILPKK